MPTKKSTRGVCRGPEHAVRVSIISPEQGLTKQSFKDECDINQIVDTYARTGLVPNLQTAQPQYGESPDTDFFTAACAIAASASALEDGLEPSEPEPDPQDPEPEKTPQSASEEPETEPLAQS